jgi:hypothetical protein
LGLITYSTVKAAHGAGKYRAYFNVLLKQRTFNNGTIVYLVPITKYGRAKNGADVNFFHRLEEELETIKNE